MLQKADRKRTLGISMERPVLRHFLSDRYLAQVRQSLHPWSYLKRMLNKAQTQQAVKRQLGEHPQAAFDMS